MNPGLFYGKSGKSRKGKAESKVRKEEPLSGAATHNDYSTASAYEDGKLLDATNKLEDEGESWSLPKPIERHLNWKRRRETWVPVITVFISLVALGVISFQAIIYVQQRQVMDKQRDVMERQVEQSERGLRISERAYVGVASLTPYFDRKEVVIMIENIGKVPARNVRVEAHAYRRLADELKLSGSTKYFDAGGIQLFPGSLKMSVVIPMPNIRPEEAKGILIRSEGFYVAGIIKYEDGFEKKDNRTDFAFRYNPPPNERWTADSELAKQLEKLLQPNHP